MYEDLFLNGSSLTIRHQRVTVDGDVISGVSAYGPLVYINDINESYLQFTDNCVIYRTITTPQDSKHLQDELHKVNEWKAVVNENEC